MGHVSKMNSIQFTIYKIENEGIRFIKLPHLENNCWNVGILAYLKDFKGAAEAL